MRKTYFALAVFQPETARQQITQAPQVCAHRPAVSADRGPEGQSRAEQLVRMRGVHDLHDVHRLITFVIATAMVLTTGSSSIN